MITATFSMQGREKTFTDENVKLIMDSLIKDYLEAIPEINKIVVEEVKEGEVNKMTYEGHNISQSWIATIRNGLQI